MNLKRDEQEIYMLQPGSDWEKTEAHNEELCPDQCWERKTESNGSVRFQAECFLRFINCCQSFCAGECCSALHMLLLRLVLWPLSRREGGVSEGVRD